MNELINEQALIINLVLDKKIRKRFFKKDADNLVKYFKCSKKFIKLSHFDITHQSQSTKGLMMAEMRENLFPLCNYINLDKVYDEYTDVYPSKLTNKLEEYIRFLSYTQFLLLSQKRTFKKITLEIICFYMAMFQSSLMKERYEKMFHSLKNETLVEINVNHHILEILGDTAYPQKKK